MQNRGRYIVIEGNDGTGKSTQVERLEKRLVALGIQCSQIHEPDGVPTASKLRDIIKDGRLERDAWTNVLLFTAARRLNWLQDIQPSLEAGKFVVAARNWYSTVVYQGYGQGEDIDRIEQFTLDNISIDYLKPDLTIVLSMEAESSRTERIAKRESLERPDTFESMPDDFQKRVNDGYVDFAQKQGIEIIDASRSIDEVEKDIWNRVEQLMEAKS
nr:Crp-like helix-turn-helix domain protein [uncultured bacterium]AIA11278.1 thymidylate kinase [uncultured bacterium]